MTQVQIETLAAPLGLIGFEHVKVPFDDNGPLNFHDTVLVPPKTEFVHIAVTGVDMGLGSASDNTHGDFSSLLFQAAVEHLSPPNLTYSVRAQFISQDPMDRWNGTIMLTILCFGKVLPTSASTDAVSPE
jgi:hypothetical protein